MYRTSPFLAGIVRALVGVCILLFTIIGTLQGQTVGRATGGDSISADSASTSNTAQTGYVPLDGPTIRETSAGQFTSGETIILTVPSGFEWNTNFDTSPASGDGTNTDIQINPVGANNTDLTVGNISVSSSEISIEITNGSKSAGKGKGPGEIDFTGIEVRPTTGQLPNSGIITNSGTANIGTNDFGELTMAVGAKTSITIETKADGSGSTVQNRDVTAGNSLKVYSIARDQFDNYISNINVGENGWQLINITGGVKQADLVAASTAKNATLTGELTGSAQIEASDGSGTAVPSGTITVVPANTDQMVITQQPVDTTTAGQSFNPHPILELRDEFGNTVTDDDSRTVTATASEGGSLLNGTTSTTPANGVLEFTNLNIEQVITSAIIFQSSGLSDVTSDSVTIVPAPPADLSYLQQPSNTIKGGTVSPPVELQLKDAFGNTVPDADSTVTISQVDSTGDISGTLSTLTNSSGVASFSNITIDQNANTDSLRIQAVIQNVSMGAIVSDYFLILEQGQLAGFEITDPNGNALSDQTAGQPFDINVRAIDGSGSTVTDYDGEVKVSSTGGLSQGKGPHSGFSSGELTVTITDTAAGDNSLTAVNPANTNITGTAGVTILPSGVDNNETVVSADPESIVADGISTTTVTIQLRDQYQNNKITGGENISIETSAGSLVANNTSGDSLAANDNGDGTYTAELTSSTSVETADIEVYRDGTLINNSLSVDFTAGKLNSFVIRNANENNITQQVAGQAFNISVRAIDQFGNTVDFDGTLQFDSNVGVNGGTTESISDGFLSPHSITINTASEDVTLTVSAQNTSVTGQSNSFEIVADAPDPDNSTISAAPSLIQNEANGGSKSAITVVLRDVFNNRNFQQQTVSLNIERTDGSSASASLLGTSFDSQDGAYRDTVASTSTVEDVRVFGSVNGTAIGDTAVVEIVLPNEWDATPDKGFMDPQDWSEPSNWSLDRVPSTEDFVIIPTNPDGGEDPLVDEDINIGTLHIESNATISVSTSQVFTVQSDAIIDGNLNFDTAGEFAVNGNLSGSGSYTANGAHTTNIGGDISVYTYQAAATGAKIRTNGSQLQLITSTNFSSYDLLIESDTEIRTSADISDLIVSSGTSFDLTQGSGITLDLTDIFGTGTFDLNDNTLIVRGNIDLSDILTENAHVDYRGTQKQVIENFEKISTLTIDNSSGVRIFATNNMEVTGQLNLANGPLIIPSGVSLIANNKNITNGKLIAHRIIDGSRGWRMLSPPLNSNYDDFLDSTVTQGYNGAFYDAGVSPNDTLQPSVLYYREDISGTDNQRWRAPDNASDNLTAGRGLFVYFFGNVPDDSRYNNSLPDTLEIQGQEFEGTGSSFDFGITYTAEADTGWNMVGNPFAATLNWDASGWTKTNMDNVIYVWDPSDNTYKTWNGIDGSLGNGLIKPFQAFWVKANAASPALSVDKSAKTTGGTFRGKQKEPESIEFLVEADSLRQSTHITLSTDGSTGKDKRDAFRLLPFETGTYLALYTTLKNGTELAINNLGRNFGKQLNIPLHVGGFKNGDPLNGEYTLSWPNIGTVPDEWTLTLVDRHQNKEIDLRANSFYSFNLSQSKQKKPVRNTIENLQLVKDPTSQKTKNGGESRFVIQISPGADGSDLPDEYALGINYPNPFTDFTTIKYATPLEGHVQIHIYDILGRKVKTIVDERQEANYHQVRWDPRQLSSGVYICLMRAGGKQFTKKLTFIK